MLSTDKRTVVLSECTEVMPGGGGWVGGGRASEQRAASFINSVVVNIVLLPSHQALHSVLHVFLNVCYIEQ